MSTRHQTRDRKNRMFNMVQAYAAQDRIPSMHLSDTRPTSDQIDQIPIDRYLPSREDFRALKDELVLATAMIISTNVNTLQKHQSKFKPTPHEYDTEPTMKSDLVCRPFD